MRTAVYFLVPPPLHQHPHILLSHSLFVSIVSGRPVSAVVTAHHMTWIGQCLIRNTQGRPIGIFVLFLRKFMGRMDAADNEHADILSQFGSLFMQRMLITW